MKDNNIFNFFRDLYNHQLKFHEDCELAFQHANKLFFIKYGYQPYNHIEDFFSELFSKQDGFKLFD